MYPVTQCRSRDMQAVPHQNVFTAIQRHMVAALADNQRRQQTRTGNALFDGLRRSHGGGDSALAAGAGILLQMVIVHFQRSRHEVQQTTHVFADAGLLAAARITDLLVLSDIVMMLELWQSIQTEFPSRTLAATTRCTLLCCKS